MTQDELLAALEAIELIVRRAMLNPWADFKTLDAIAAEMNRYIREHREHR